jgi:capsular exopolysaccharide synthesis family protein
VAIVAGLAIGFAVVQYLMTPKEYRATSLIQIERRVSVPLRGIEDAWLESWWNVEYYPTQYRLLQSRGLAERVVVNLGLDRDAEFNPGGAAASQRAATAADDDAAVGALAGRLLGGLEIVPLRNTQLVEVSYRSRSPELAARIANGVVDAYIDWGIETRASVAGKASTFFGQQIEALKQEIADKDAQLQAYGRRTDIVSLDPDANVTLRKLEALNQDYVQAVSERISREARMRELESAAPDRAADLLEEELVRRQRGELSELEREYAAKLDNFKPEWPAMIELRSRIEQARANLGRVSADALARGREAARAEYQTALRREQSLAAALGQVKAENRELNSAAVEYSNLQIEISTKRQLLDELLRRQSETDVTSRLQATRESNVRVVDRALLPGGPFRPSLSRNLGLGAGAGLLAGIALVFLLHYMDRTMKTREEVERLLDLPVLAVVPDIGEAAAGGKLARGGYGYGYGYGASDVGRGRLARRRPGGDSGPVEPGAVEEVPRIELLPHLRPRLAISEAYRSLRTALQLATATELKAMAVTSAVPGEGKTTTATNLAVVFAQLGKRVLLVDADLRKPRLSQVFGLATRAGLVHHLTHAAELEQIVATSAVPNLWVVPAGPVPPNPSELLASPRFGEFLAWARRTFDLVLFDTAPTLAVADALLVGTAVDGLVLCLRAGKVERRDARACLDRLRHSEVRLLGAVLNRARPVEGRYGASYGGYGGYGEEPAPAGRAAAGAGGA